METGTIMLTNTRQYPLNDSARLVLLARERQDAAYPVMAEVLRSDGEAGEVRVTDKAVNGFRIAYTGSAAAAELRWWAGGLA